MSGKERLRHEVTQLFQMLQATKARDGKQTTIGGQVRPHSSGQGLEAVIRLEAGLLIVKCVLEMGARKLRKKTVIAYKLTQIA